MILRFPAKCSICRTSLPAGTNAIAAKIGGSWDFACPDIGLSQADFRKLREGMLLSLGDDGGDLDHEDCRLLDEFAPDYSPSSNRPAPRGTCAERAAAAQPAGRPEGGAA